MAKGVNDRSLRFEELEPEPRDSFVMHPRPILLSLPAKTHLYKWTQYPLIGRNGFASAFWSPWEPIRIGGLTAPGFKELRMRYQNRGGEVGRPQEFMRARNAVTDYWNTMESITKAELRVEVWGFLGVCAPKPVSKSEEKKNEPQVLFIGGNYQLVLPWMTSRHILKL